MSLHSQPLIDVLDRDAKLVEAYIPHDDSQCPHIKPKRYCGNRLSKPAFCSIVALSTLLVIGAVVFGIVYALGRSYVTLHSLCPVLCCGRQWGSLLPRPLCRWWHVWLPTVPVCFPWLPALCAPPPLSFCVDCTTHMWVFHPRS